MQLGESAPLAHHPPRGPAGNFTLYFSLTPLATYAGNWTTTALFSATQFVTSPIFVQFFVRPRLLINAWAHATASFAALREEGATLS